MANARVIWEDYLLLGKSVTLEFTSVSEVKNFRAALQVYKNRFNTRMQKLGFTGSIERRTIVVTPISSSPTLTTVRVSMAEREEKRLVPRFRIVEASEGES